MRPFHTRSLRLVEFTGERVIPDQVEPDLWSEHLARYAFAQRYAAGKHVLDCGCGTGYGTFELGQAAAEVTGLDLSCDAIEYARGDCPPAATQGGTLAWCAGAPPPPMRISLLRCVRRPLFPRLSPSYMCRRRRTCCTNATSTFGCSTPSCTLRKRGSARRNMTAIVFWTSIASCWNPTKLRIAGPRVWSWILLPLANVSISSTGDSRRSNNRPSRPLERMKRSPPISRRRDRP